MSDSEFEEMDPEDEKFGLDQPTREYQNFKPITRDSEGRSQAYDANVSHSSQLSSEKHLHNAEIKYKAMGWRGVDEDEEVEELEDDFGVEKKPIPEDELDMTPMVDVTFLLLIFFMVTASFTMQKSLQQPKAQTEEPSEVQSEIIDVDLVEIAIDQNNNYYVTSRTDFEKEAPSDREMREILRDAKENSAATKLIIKAHMDCQHKRVITAWDAGVTMGFTEFEIKTTEQDY